jgi:hypothetical protein
MVQRWRMPGTAAANFKPQCSRAGCERRSSGYLNRVYMQPLTPLPCLTGAAAAPLSEEARSMIDLVAALPSCASPPSPLRP